MVYTNTIPYPLWEELQRDILKDLLPVVKEVELMLAAYLHKVGIEYEPQSQAVDLDGEDEDGATAAIEVDDGSLD